MKKDFKTENQYIEDFESDLQFWKEKLQIPKLSDKHFSFQNIHSYVDSSCLALTRRIGILKNDILLGQDYKLETVKDLQCQDLAKIKIETKDCGNCSQNFLNFLSLKYHSIF